MNSYTSFIDTVVLELDKGKQVFTRFFETLLVAQISKESYKDHFHSCNDDDSF